MLGCKDIGIRKSEFVAKTQFLYPGGGGILPDFWGNVAMYSYPPPNL